MLALGLAFAVPTGAAEPENGPATEVRFRFTLHENEAGSTGVLIVAIWDAEAEYLTGTPIRSHAFPVENFPQEVVFGDLPPGTYAMSVILDENDNQDLDTSPFGMPREPFAFSNNARNRFGPADFADATFALQAGTPVEQDIVLR